MTLHATFEKFVTIFASLLEIKLLTFAAHDWKR